MHGTLSEQNWTQPENHPKPPFVQPAVVEKPLPAEAVQMADDIKKTYAEVQSASLSYCQKRCDLAQMLIQAKRTIPHGQFYKWLKNECGIATRTADRYMEQYNNFKAIESAKVAETVMLDGLKSGSKDKDETDSTTRAKRAEAKALNGKTDAEKPAKDDRSTAVKILARFTPETLRDELLPELHRRGILGQEPEPDIIEGTATEVIERVAEPVGAEILEAEAVAEPERVEADTDDGSLLTATTIGMEPPAADRFAQFTDTDLVAELDRRLKPLGRVIKIIMIEAEPVQPAEVEETPASAPAPNPVKSPRKRVDTSDDPRRERAWQVMKANGLKTMSALRKLVEAEDASVAVPVSSFKGWLNGSQTLRERFHALVDAALDRLETTAQKDA